VKDVDNSSPVRLGEVQNKSRYKFPYGDFRNVHRCGALAAESCAGQYKHFAVGLAAAQPGRRGR
jgi:hypothetical protein